MITISISELVPALLVAMGVPTAITGFCFWLLERRIEKRDKKKQKEEAALLEEQGKRDRAREELEVLLVQGINAYIALGEATAKAVQRIPDAHCNGDMKKALEYATSIKHDQKNFLAQQGIHALLDD